MKYFDLRNLTENTEQVHVVIGERNSGKKSAERHIPHTSTGDVRRKVREQCSLPGQTEED